MKKIKKPLNKLQDNISYLYNINTTEAKKVAENARNAPHLMNKPIKYDLK